MERDFARKQIARMTQMRGFPKNDIEPLGDLIDALMKAETEETARAVIAGFLEEATADTPCPMASEIRKAIIARLEREQGELRYDPECPKCEGCGFEDRGRGPRCNCLARRPPPDYRKLKGAEPIGDSLKDQLRQAAKTVGAKK